MIKQTFTFLTLFLSLVAHSQELEGGPHKTYFMAGAIFAGEKENPKSATFSQILIKSFKSIVKPGEFKVIDSSILRPGMGIFCFNRGQSPIKNPERHRIVGDVIDELLTDYEEISKHATGPGTINLIGSSYGSVVSAQTTLFLLKNLGTEVDGYYLDPKTKINLVLTASAIDHESPLFQELLGFTQNRNVSFTLTDLSDPKDPMVGAVGATSKEKKHNLKVLAQLLLAREPMAVLGTHFKGMKDLSRVDTILKTILVEVEGHGPVASERSKEFTDQLGTQKLADLINQKSAEMTDEFLKGKGFKQKQ